MWYVQVIAEKRYDLILWNPNLNDRNLWNFFIVHYVSAPFNKANKDLFHGIENPDTFFRPAYRSMLVSFPSSANNH